jgi:hypothetical protein
VIITVIALTATGTIAHRTAALNLIFPAISGFSYGAYSPDALSPFSDVGVLGDLVSSMSAGASRNAKAPAVFRRTYSPDPATTVAASNSTPSR